jgi:Rad3-related DNA helicase
MLQELSSITFWDFKHGCNKVNDSKSFLEFLKIQTAKVKEDYAKFKGSKKDKVALFRSLSKYERILDDFEYAPQDFSFAREMKPYKGKMEACVSVRLLSMENVHSRLWAGKTNKIILFSATMLPAEVKMIGIEKMGACYYEAASPIPPSRRMAYYQPVAPMNKTDAATSIMPMLERIMEIANARPNDKGLIHCSYAIGQMLAERLRLKWKTDSRFMVFDKDSKKDVLDDFMNSDKPRILIGAGLSEGLNLVEDLCRFQIITKVMYPNLGDPHVSNLKKRNPKYYAWMAIKTLIQSVGRSTRTENDFSETFILDESFYTLYVYNKALFPKWFQESLKFDLRRANG